MEDIDTLDYYYDEDFSVPFDIGLTEENNNSNIDIDYVSRGFSRYAMCEDDEEDENIRCRESEMQKLIMPVNLFYNDSRKGFRDKEPKNSILRHSIDGEFKRPQSNYSAAIMSCSSSSSPPSSSSINFYDEKHGKCYCDKISLYESRYSLKSKGPLLALDNGRILANYHLNFVPPDYYLESQSLSIDIKDCLNDDDNISIDQVNYTEITIARLFFAKIAEEYKEVRGRDELNDIKLKPESLLWRQIKFLMSCYCAGWNIIKLFSKFRNKISDTCHTTDEIFSSPGRRRTKRRQRLSCTTLELFNSMNGFRKIVNDVKCSNVVKNKEAKCYQHFSCQFPPKRALKQKSLTDSPQKVADIKYDYPGIGKLNVPKQSRISSSSLLFSEFPQQLSFLQASVCSESSNSIMKLKKGKPIRYNSLNQDSYGEGGVLRPCLRREENSKKICGSKKCSESCTAEVVNCKNTGGSTEEQISNKRKSVSFDCPPDLSGFENTTNVDFIVGPQEIPRTWGLLAPGTRRISTDLIATFEYGNNRDIGHFSSAPNNQHKHHKGGIFDRRSSQEDPSVRLKNISGEVARAMRQVSERVGTGCNLLITPSADALERYQQQLTSMCNAVCTGSPGDDNCPLSTAIDGLLTLLSDGLTRSVTSAGSNLRRTSQRGAVTVGPTTNASSGANVRNFSAASTNVHTGGVSKSIGNSGGSGSSGNNTGFYAARLWILIEDTTRSYPELNHLAMKIRHSATKENQQQLLRIFIARSFTSGLLHVWLKSLVNNEILLARFYSPTAFVRQSANNEVFITLSQMFKSISQYHNHSCQSTKVSKALSSTSNVNGNTLNNPPSAPPPVTISRRVITTKDHPVSTDKTAAAAASASATTTPSIPSTYPKSNSFRTGLYSTETTESESFVDGDDSRSSQSGESNHHNNTTIRDLSNNNTFVTTIASHNHPLSSHLVKNNCQRVIKKSYSSNMSNDSSNSNSITPSRKYTSKVSVNKSCNVSIPLKTVRNQPLVGSKQKNLRSDTLIR